MARKTTVILVDDLDGGEAERTVTFALDGSHYEIDLNQSNIAHLVESLGPFIKAARTTTRRRQQRKTTSGNVTAQARAWARSAGFEVSERGRIPAEILEAYQRRN